MKELIDKIKTSGIALNEHVLKVDSFVNHQVDPVLMNNIGKNFAEYYKDKGVTKVFTVESSGIAPAVFTAIHMGLELVVLKKNTSKILSGEVYQSTIYSFTKGVNYELTLSKKFINKDDNIVIIDDFLANGQAALGAINLVEQAGARVVGIGILIEKTFQEGRKILDNKGYDTYSLARIKSLGVDKVEFED